MPGAFRRSRKWTGVYTGVFTFGKLGVWTGGIMGIIVLLVLVIIPIALYWPSKEDQDA